MKKSILFVLLNLLLISCGEVSSSNDVSSSSYTSSSDSSNHTSSVETSSSSKESITSSEVEISHSSLQDNIEAYYKSINKDATGATLMNSLHKLIRNHSVTSYKNLNSCYAQTDVKPGTNIIWDMYSNIEYQANKNTCGNYKKEGDCWNKEHSIPASWFKDVSPMYSDLFQVYPTDGYVNNRRSNYPFGEVQTAKYISKNGSKLGSSVDGIGSVFEPIDEYKGDFARTYFYFATCYMDKSINNANGKYCFTSGTSYPKLTDYSIKLFKNWAELDPVSSKEINRNEAVYKIQGNRNPFIDYPEFSKQIWG